MISTKIRTTVQRSIETPSRFGMPAAGHAFVARRRAVQGTTVSAFGSASGSAFGAGVQGTTQAAKGIADLAPCYVPGTSAWRPPSC